MRKDKGMRGGIIVNIASIAGLGTHFWLPVYAGNYLLWMQCDQFPLLVCSQVQNTLC